MKRGHIHIYTGDGGGKTAAALGIALRSLGQGRRVAIIQFLHANTDLGEWKFQQHLDDPYGSNYHIYQFGSQKLIDPRHITQEDKDAANQALGFAKAEMMEKLRPHLLILDDLNHAISLGVVTVEDTMAILKQIPPDIDIYITGKDAPRELVKIADFVTVIKDKKRPARIPVRKGIDY